MDYININGNFQKPKYQQIVYSVLEAIENGELKLGSKLPSLNKICKEFQLSQDTVLYAYNELKARGIISSTVGKGYYIISTAVHESHKIFLLFDTLTLYKESLYNTILDKFKGKGRVEIFFHHNNSQVFKSIVKNAAGNYSAYVIIPILQSEPINVLQELPEKSVYILDLGLKLLSNKYACVCQNFEKDVYNSLEILSNKLKKYESFYLVCPGNKFQYKEIQYGFEKFAKDNKLNSKVLNNLDKQTVGPKEAYLVINDIDLVKIIKASNTRGLTIGKDIGIISYNKSPLKEVMANGITTISTDFEEMGKTISNMILKKKRDKVINRIEIIKGGSL